MRCLIERSLRVGHLLGSRSFHNTIRRYDRLYVKRSQPFGVHRGVAIDPKPPGDVT
jgi:hypothetical protein